MPRTSIKKRRYQAIYETLTATEDEAIAVTGMGCVKDYRLNIQEFLIDNEWDIDKFMLWIDGNPSLPSKRDMASGLLSAAALAVKSGFEFVSEEKQKQRLDICQNECSYYRKHDGRCSRCGCWTKGKSKLEAWHCPIDKW